MVSTVRIPIASLAALLWLVSLSQAEVMDTAWVRYYDDTANFTRGDVGIAIDVDADGNAYVTGHSDVVSYLENYDITTVKYGPTGNLHWVRHYNGPGNADDGACAVRVDASGDNIYVGGTSTGLGTGFDYVILKYSWKGTPVWERRYDGPGSGEDSLTALTLDGADSIYVTGYSTGIGTGYDYTTLKYDRFGNLQWERHYNGPGDSTDQAFAIAVDTAGNVYVTGASWDNGFDYATVKYDAGGNLQWVRRYDGPAAGTDRAAALAVDGTGSVYVTGYSTGVGSGHDYTTLKYDSAGNLLWEKHYDGTGSSTDEARALRIDAAANICVTGLSWGGYPWEGGTSYDWATLKYDSSGNLLWERRLNGPGNSEDDPTDLAIDSSGSVYVTGSTVGEGTWDDCTTVKYDSGGALVWEQRHDHPTLGGFEAGLALSVLSDGAVYVAGYQSFIVAGSGDGSDYLTIKYVRCDCPCHADPECDDAIDVLDVVAAVAVAFREQEPTQQNCTHADTDVDCSGFTNVFDVVHFVNVAFRNEDPVDNFCVPCP